MVIANATDRPHWRNVEASISASRITTSALQASGPVKGAVSILRKGEETQSSNPRAVPDTSQVAIQCACFLGRNTESEMVFLKVLSAMKDLDSGVGNGRAHTIYTGRHTDYHRSHQAYVPVLDSPVPYWERVRQLIDDDDPLGFPYNMHLRSAEKSKANGSGALRFLTGAVIQSRFLACNNCFTMLYHDNHPELDEVASLPA